jgi:hypothetical protein
VIKLAKSRGAVTIAFNVEEMDRKLDIGVSWSEKQGSIY